MRNRLRRTGAAPAHQSRGAHPRHREAWSTGPRVLATVGAVAVTGLVLALGSTSGTMALWNHTSELPGVTITAGGVDLSIAAGLQPGSAGQSAAALDPEIWATMLPGDVVGTTVTVTNQREGAVLLSAALDPQAAAQGDVTFRLAPGACQGTVPDGTVLTAAQSAPVGPALAYQGSATYCLQAELSAQAPAAAQGTQLVPAFTLTMTGTLEVAP